MTEPDDENERSVEVGSGVSAEANEAAPECSGASSADVSVDEPVEAERESS